MVTLELDTREFERQMRNLGALTSRHVADELKFQARGGLNEVIGITPPAHGGKWGSTKIAQAMGEKAVARDISGGGSIVRGKRRAGVFTILSDSLINNAISTGTAGGDSTRLWATKDGRVYGTQRHFFRPDASDGEMRAHHKQYFRHGKMSSAGTYTRDIGRWKWIDQMVVKKSTFERYLKKQQSKVGWYASGWKPAALALGAKVPAYMRRHDAPGSVEIRTGTDRLSVRFSHNVPGYYRLEPDVRRRLQWAIDRQAKKMETAIERMVKRNARTVGLEVT